MSINLNNIKQNILKLASDKRVAVSVSGGVDSMCLLWMFLQFGNVCKDFFVLTFNHQLRESSGRDCEFVKNFCALHSVKCFEYSCDIAKISEQSGKSIELQAREWRQQIFKQILNSKADLIALGHHQDDQVETVLYRIFRGTGLRGLCGMDMLSRDGLFRPLLKEKKADIVHFAIKNSIQYVQDHTNFTDIYDRNFIRNRIVPLIEQRWDTKNIANLSKHAAQNQVILDSFIDKSLIKIENDDIILPIICVSQSFYFEYISYALSLLKIQTDNDMIERVKSLAKGQSGKMTNLIGHNFAIKEFDCIRICKKNSEQIDTQHSLTFKGLGEYCFLKIQFSLCKVVPKVSHEFWFDLDKIPLNAVWRTRQVGDFIQSFGSNYKRSLKNFFISKKIPVSKRDSVILLADGSDILLILGVQISEKIKCDQNTKNASTVIIKKS
ncbi:MAG: tRNA lysidine(34) synthetase TilS [Clostridiales bacterium]|jgi:tRNA(Ile)-lysidine synthase|nr:tRNA lysidine(34) synthetase TilS [Clostridiales bacterium]